MYMTLPSLLAFHLQCDLRESTLMRVAPAPLYNSFTDVQRFYTMLKEAMEAQEDHNTCHDNTQHMDSTPIDNS